MAVLYMMAVVMTMMMVVIDDEGGDGAVDVDRDAGDNADGDDDGDHHDDGDNADGENACSIDIQKLCIKKMPIMHCNIAPKLCVMAGSPR